MYNIFEKAGITMTPEEAHMLAALEPVKRFWYADSNGKDMNPSILKCIQCHNPLRWGGSQMCRSRGLGMTCIFRLLSPKVRCVNCGKTWVAWNPVIRAQVPPNFAVVERLDHVGNRFLEPGVTDFLCAILKQTFHRGALKAKHPAVVAS